MGAAKRGFHTFGRNQRQWREGFLDTL